MSFNKHTIQGIMGYTPVVFRLEHCARPEIEQTNTTGHWEFWGYGVFSKYNLAEAFFPGEKEGEM